jgi:hypothetical protein
MQGYDLRNWLFLNMGGRGWEWRRLDVMTGDELERSTQPFSTLIACVRDAKTHGYGGRRPSGLDTVATEDQ